MKLYHYTPIENAGKIEGQGLKAGADGYVYLAESEKLAQAFAQLYGLKMWVMLTVEVEISLLDESTDHSEEYFMAVLGSESAKVYMHKGDIPRRKVRLFQTQRKAGGNE